MVPDIIITIHIKHICSQNIYCIVVADERHNRGVRVTSTDQRRANT